MKIAVTSKGPNLDDQVDARFGRCAYFLIVETETMDVEVVENPNTTLGGGAGIQSAQVIADRGAEVLLTGNCGPNAHQTLSAADVKVVVGVSGKVRDAVRQYESGAFSAAGGPNVGSHFGVGAGGGGQGPGYQAGPGMGMGRGRGGGRGRGMGRGLGRWNVGQTQMPGGTGRTGSSPGTRQEELEELRAQAEAIDKQLSAVTERIAQLDREEKGAARLVAETVVEKCTGCGVCQGICPVEAITVNGTAIVDAGKCTGCGQCVAECPEDALVLKKA